FEFQQSRIADRGNKWAAWFRYDMEIFPGPNFNINGAMHTDSNLFFRNNNGQITSYMISSHNSCVYSQEASEITVGDVSEDGSFQGQIVRGAIFNNQYGGGNATIHTFSTDDNPPNVRTLTTANDSVDGGTPAAIAVNPLVLYTQDRLQHSTAPGAASWNRVAAWETSDIRTEGRIFNKRVPKPFVDDFFRADNRWGPKPRYSDTDPALDVANPANGVGLGDDIENIDQVTDPVTGFDGYWERQAVNYGLRLVVGQRLELGNPNGWNFNPTPDLPSTQDRLYPPNAPLAVGTKIRANEYRQKTALRDNLAAVQSMVVYHYDHANGGDYPAACMALTAHPGTLQTIRNSRDFTNFPGTNLPYPNFLAGTGTNGWEFDFYAEGAFGTAVNNPDSALGRALRNLAHLAGDPNGGAPSFNPVQDGFVHPFPYMAMWGDFSPLRRIFDDYIDASAGAVPYASLSSADRATLHSAACTLGMLGQNLQFATDTSKIRTGANSWANRLLGTNIQGQIITQIGKPIWDAFGGGNAGPAAGSLATQCTQDPSDANRYDCTDVKPTKEQLIAIALAAGDLNANQVRFIDLLGDLTQVERDRTFGFEPSPDPITFGDYEVQQGPRRYIFRFPDNCHPNNTAGTLGPLFNAAPGAGGVSDERAGVALVCASMPKYPSLFYLFPKATHDQNDGQPLTEEFIDPANTAYILNADETGGVNLGFDYEPVEPGTIALAPRAIANWQTPIPPAPSGVAFNPQANHIIGGIGNVREMAFLDKGMFNGREQMGVRVLDIDLQKLTTALVPGSTDYWLSDIACDPDTQDCDVFTEGIIYAFREDAVREDQIVRPSTPAANSDACLTVAAVTSADCRMVTTPGAEADPPLTAAGISLKPVDFFADPDRRPYGFRLRNGADMSRGRQRAVGMTFVTDNSTYIMGNFNLHSEDGTPATLIEEFTARIGGVDWTMDNFYNNRTEANVDDSFSQPADDTWRPVEILTDALTILSAGFLDGAAEDTYIRARPGGSNANNTSYMNQSRPNNAQEVVRENGTISAATHPSPVFVDRNGDSFVETAPIRTAVAAADWTGLTEDANRRRNVRSVPGNAFVNAMFIGGVVPNRVQQSNGGLHNFPRLLENWTNRSLQIAGAFFQLNFSTGSTGPFEHDAWQPGQNPDNQERLGYYIAPIRRWGYDPGLLYYPPAAAARRFVSVGTPRSEYFRELPSDDPYITNLRCAVQDGGGFVYTDESIRGDCPA
ncbi:MAG: hypothetical protein ACFCVB_08530, partial [Nodosilinea sp.]